MNLLKGLFNRKYNVLVLGCDGMLGYDLYTKLKLQSLLADSSIGTVIGLDVKDGFDFSKRHVLGNFFDASIHFDYCINCIAHTNTSAAQNTKEGFRESYRLNSLLPKYVAESCNYHKTKLIHISTDYVFSENTFGVSVEDATPTMQIMTVGEEFPVNVYGMHKLFGELFIKNEFEVANPRGYAILRTSWLYGNHNHKSFVHKFLRNVKNCVLENRPIEVTKNEYSIPTSTSYLVQRIIDIIDTDEYGVFNAAPNCQQALVSRRDFAEAILRNLSNDFKINGKVLNTLDVIGVERDTYQPTYSMMKSSFEGTFGWEHYLRKFIEENELDLKEYLEKA